MEDSFDFGDSLALSGGMDFGDFAHSSSFGDMDGFSAWVSDTFGGASDGFGWSIHSTPGHSGPDGTGYNEGGGFSDPFDWFNYFVWNGSEGGQSGEGGTAPTGDNPHPWMSDEYVQHEIDRLDEWFQENYTPMTEAEERAHMLEAAEFYQELGSNIMATGVLIGARFPPVGGAISAFGAFWYLVGGAIESHYQLEI